MPITTTYANTNDDERVSLLHASTKIKESVRWGVILGASILLMGIYSYSHNAMKAASEKATYSVAATLIEEAEISSVVRVDQYGKVVFLNNLAVEQLQLRLGDDLRNVLAPASQNVRTKLYVAAMQKYYDEHVEGEDDTSVHVECVVLGRDGEKYRAVIDVKSETQGAIAFIKLKSKAKK